MYSNHKATQFIYIYNQGPPNKCADYFFASKCHQCQEEGFISTYPSFAENNAQIRGHYCEIRLFSSLVRLWDLVVV